MTVTHAFVSAIEDGEDDSLIRPSDWNAEHIVEGLEGGSGGLLGLTVWKPGSQQNLSTSSSTLVDVDATNAAVTFTAPPSGAVLVTLEVGGYSTAAWMELGVREGSTALVAGRVIANNAGSGAVRRTFRISGLTGGSSHTYKAAYSAADSGGTANLYINNDDASVNAFGVGALLLEVRDAAIGTGGVTLGSSPGVSVRASANQTVNNSNVLFDTEEFDTDGFHSTVTNTDRLTVPAGLDGKYLVTGSAGLTTANALDIRFFVNGSQQEIWAQQTGTGSQMMSITGVADLAAGDYVAVNCYTAGSNRTLYGQSGGFASSFSMVRLGGSASEANTMPWHVVIPAETEPDTTINTWSIVLHTEALNFANGGTGVTNGLGTPAQNDEIAWDVVLAAGTWKLTMHSRKSSNVGIYTVSVEGTSVGTIDGYSASAAAGLDTISGIAIATTGKHRLKFKMATKNASSSGYVGNPQAISLRRTA